jgi:Asp-tRNA(Asn)/Glu-tRNA(Gln) amidotransferase A subunit family amidase
MGIVKYCLALLLLVGAAALSAQQLDLRAATVQDINRALEAGTITSEELVRRYLARIEAYNEQGPALRAVIVTAPNAIERARELDAERARSGPRSPLHGIPVVVKDTVDTIDAPTSGGAIGYANTTPLLDATVVRKIKEAGAIILAKGNLDEFNLGSQGISSIFGQTLNPYDLGRNPGGSSAGPGVSVNVGFAAIGIGTETGASIRSPSSNNSLVGLAPSQGLISRAGILPISYTQDRAGPMARSVWDAALLASYMKGLDGEDLFTHASLGKVPEQPYTTFLHPEGLRGARIGVLRDLFREGAEYEEINQLIEAEIAVMQEQGAIIVDGLSTGMDLVKFFPLARASTEEFLEAFRVYSQRRGDTLPYETLQELVDSGEMLPRLMDSYQRYIDRGPTEFDPEYLARLANRENVKSLLVDLMDKYELDALVHPFKSLAAPPLGTGDRGVRDNPISAITGLPALVVPAGVNSEGLPIAVEFLGRPFSEAVLFRLGYGYEQATRHRVLPETTPPLAGEFISVGSNVAATTD